MKKLISLLLAMLLCLGCLVPAFAEEPEPTTAAPDATQATTEPPEETTEAPALPEAYLKWAHGNEYSDRGAFDRSFRQYYTQDPDVEIIDGMVFFKTPVRRFRPTELCYQLIDYFATDELERTVTELRIPGEVKGCPVSLLAYDQTVPWPEKNETPFSNDTVTKVVLGEGITTAPYFAFRNFTALKTVKLPSTLRMIYDSAFENCGNLKKIVGAGNVGTVHAAAFKNCKKLASFAHMESITWIIGDAFYGCGFETLTLAGTLSIVGPTGDMDYYATSNAFANCKKLKDVTFLSLKKYPRLWIGGGAFRGCTALESVTFPKKTAGVHLLHRAFQDCTKLNTLKNVGKLKSISNFAFARCTSLESAVLPEGIEYVAEQPFKDCKRLKTLDIRSEDIDLFGRNYYLYGVYYYGANYTEEEQSTTNFVKYLPKTCTVLVPTLAMKQIAQAHGCKNTIRVKVSVAAPKQFKATQKGDTTVLKWSAVPDADGYKLYVWNEKAQAFKTLETVKAPATRLNVQTTATRFALRAYREIDGDVSLSKAVES